MVYLIYLVVIIALLALAWMVLAAVGLILFYVMVAIAIGTVLIAHGRVYFMGDHPGASRGLMYVPVLLTMLIAVAAWVPGMGFLVKDALAEGMSFLGQPWVPGILIAFCALAALFFALGFRQESEGLVQPFYGGTAYIHAIRTAIRALPSLVEAGRRTLPWMFSHWIGFLAGIAAAVVGIPIALGLLAISVAASILMGVVAGAAMALPTLLALAGFRLTGRRPSAPVTCSQCGRVHLMPSPGPAGLIHVRCACGNTLDLWEAGALGGERPPRLAWHQRPRILGAQPLAATALWLGVLFVAMPSIFRQLTQPRQTAPPPPPTPLVAPPPPMARPRKAGAAKAGQGERQTPNEQLPMPAQVATPRQAPAPVEKKPFDIQE